VQQSTVTLSILRMNTMITLAQIEKKHAELLVVTEFAFYVNGHGALKSIEIHGADELHVFQGYVSKPVDDVSVAGAIDYTGEDRYDGTRQCWVRYLQDIAGPCQGRNCFAWMQYLSRVNFGVPRSD
jgi:hypothetical protein